MAARLRSTGFPGEGNSDIAAVVLDLVMPGMGGIEGPRGDAAKGREGAPSSF